MIMFSVNPKKGEVWAQSIYQAEGARVTSDCQSLLNQSDHSIRVQKLQIVIFRTRCNKWRINLLSKVMWTYLCQGTQQARHAWSRNLYFCIFYGRLLITLVITKPTRSMWSGAIRLTGHRGRTWFVVFVTALIFYHDQVSTCSTEHKWKLTSSGSAMPGATLWLCYSIVPRDKTD